MSLSIKIETEFIRLDSLLKLAGAVTTGGEAKRLIQEGLVSLNGTPCTQRGRKLYDGDIVSIKDSKGEKKEYRIQSDFPERA